MATDAKFDIRRRRLSCDRITFPVAFERVSELVTRVDLDKALDQAVTTLRGEIVATRVDLDQAVTTLRGEMVAMEKRLSKQIKDSASEIAQEVANVMVEQLRSQVSVVDEKYQDLPSKYAALRKDLDAHAADTHLHQRRPATPGKRVRRS